MEAQYALQKKKALIPLMLTQGYEADGWLGLLLGTSMWYGFYGDALSSASTFDDRMDALCREIGGRGRADAVIAAAPDSTADRAAEMKMCDLLSSARDAGVSEEAIMDAQDDENPKATLAALVAESRALTLADDTTDERTALEGLRMRELMKRAEEQGVDREELRSAQASEQPKASIVGLLLAQRSVLK